MHGLGHRKVHVQSREHPRDCLGLAKADESCVCVAVACDCATSSAGILQSMTGTAARLSASAGNTRGTRTIKEAVQFPQGAGFAYIIVCLPDTSDRHGLMRTV